MQYGFQRTQAGLYSPSPRGLAGFQRQGMDQRKKGGGTPIVFKGSDFSLSGATSVSKAFFAPAIGDVVVVWCGASGGGSQTLTTAGGGRVWNYTPVVWGAHGYTSAYFWQVLDALDVANTWNLGGAAGYEVTAYAGNGATAVTAKITVADGNTGLTTRDIGGFTPAAASKGVITLLSDRDASVLAVTTAGFTLRQDRSLETFWESGIADKLSGYGGENIVWTMSASGTGEVVVALEVT